MAGQDCEAPGKPENPVSRRNLRREHPTIRRQLGAGQVAVGRAAVEDDYGRRDNRQHGDGEDDQDREPRVIGVGEGEGDLASNG